MISEESVAAVYRNGQVQLDAPADWPEGTPLVITPLVSGGDHRNVGGRVIIVGFGLPGRCVADLLDRLKVPYTIIERNPVTVETQRSLGRDIIQGDAADASTLARAGLDDASILALTIPEEDAVLDATSLARRLKPSLFIIARTNYSSKGMKASQLGADEVIKAEQAVALQFYDKLSRRLCRAPVGGVT